MASAVAMKRVPHDVGAEREARCDALAVRSPDSRIVPLNHCFTSRSSANGDSVRMAMAPAQTRNGDVVDATVGGSSGATLISRGITRHGNARLDDFDRRPQRR